MANRPTYHCPACGDNDVRVDHAFPVEAEVVYCAVCDWEGECSDLVTMPATLTRCGLNADWSVDAWLIGAGTPNRTDGACYLTDNENGTWSIVRRYYRDDDNDRIDTLHTFDTFAAAIAATASL